MMKCQNKKSVKKKKVAKICNNFLSRYQNNPRLTFLQLNQSFMMLVQKNKNLTVQFK